MSAPAAAAAALTALAFALRATALDLESLWFDTAHSGVLALNPSLGAVLAGAAADFQSPLYFVLLHGWLAVAQNDFWLAFPSAAAGTLIVPLAYATGRRLFGAPAGLVAALVCAVGSYQVYYSRYPRGYILLALLALLAAYWLHRALVPAQAAGAEGRRAGPWLAHLGAAVGASYTQPYAFFIIASMWAAAGLYLLRRRPRGLAALAATAAAAAAAYLPWLGSTWSQVAGVRAGADAWIEPVSRDALKTLWDWLWFKTRSEYGAPMDFTLRGGRYLLTAAMLAGAWVRRRDPGFWYVAALTLGPAALAFGFSAVVVSLWDARYLVSVSPFFALWLGAAVSALPGALARLSLAQPWRRWAALAAAALFAAMSLPPLVSLYTDPAFRSADLRGAMAAVHAAYAPGDAILHTNYQSYLPALWYDHRQPLGGDGPHPVPCVWSSMPPAWCSASPYREVYVNPALTPVAEATRDLDRGWLVVLYNHNKRGDAEVQLHQARAVLEPAFATELVRSFSGVHLLRFRRVA